MQFNAPLSLSIGECKRNLSYLSMRSYRVHTPRSRDIVTRPWGMDLCVEEIESHYLRLARFWPIRHLCLVCMTRYETLPSHNFLISQWNDPILSANKSWDQGLSGRLYASHACTSLLPHHFIPCTPPLYLPS